ncbi:molybdenum cofactor synthesis protein 2A [Ascobolus immersus RN42]|uniref:Molybdopterin synthase sulfur carrier subunit n=1 Tax=Ascobolus immersus RN42 TaxID=1160509 RepID=A0A3N4IST9_ASCIM|nr:molybdenum cofactor synthesis protein 2A [Ascobolus immersus RN42]
MADTTSAESESFKILYFAGVASFTGTNEESLPAPLPITELFATLEKKYAGIREKALNTAMVTVNLDYVDIEDKTLVIQKGDEVAIIPPGMG